MKNNGIGYIRYVKDVKTGDLKGIWTYHTDGQIFSGTGMATGIPGKAFGGNTILSTLRMAVMAVQISN